MIQVLLHFLILSLPRDPSPPQSGEKKRKRRSRKKAEPTPDHQENLDVLTDRLCIWRETDFASSDGPASFFYNSERDWLQNFCEDVVRPAFAGALPPLYESFKAKCFPEIEADFNDAEEDAIDLNQASSSGIRQVPSHQPSAEPSISSFPRPNQSTRLQRGGSAGPSDPLALPLPSRTLTRSNSITAGANHSRGANSQLLNTRREVSMRRSLSVQRDSSIGPSTGIASLKGKEKEGSNRRDAAGGMMGGSRTTMSGAGLTSTGARQGRSSSFSKPHHVQQSQLHRTEAPVHTVFVPETPMRGRQSRPFGRAATLNDLGRRNSQSQLVAVISADPRDVFDDDATDVDAAMLFTDEPDSASLDARGDPSTVRDRSGSAILVQSTPVRPRASSISSSLTSVGAAYGLGRGRGASFLGESHDQDRDELDFLAVRPSRGGERLGTMAARAGSAIPFTIPETPSK